MTRKRGDEIRYQSIRAWHGKAKIDRLLKKTESLQIFNARGKDGYV